MTRREYSICASPIPGLYAAGEVLGCFQGERYGGGGLSIGNAVVFGRLAGIAAAREALANAEGGQS